MTTGPGTGRVSTSEVTRGLLEALAAPRPPAPPESSVMISRNAKGAVQFHEIPYALTHVGTFQLSDVIRKGLVELTRNERRSDLLVEEWTELLADHLETLTPDPYAQPDAMVYLPARAFAALSNALALMVRHAIDDRETLGQLAEARNGDAERLSVLEASVRDVELSLEARLGEIVSAAIDRYATIEDRVSELADKLTRRARKAA